MNDELKQKAKSLAEKEKAAAETLDIESLQQQAGALFKKLPLLGPISWLYAQSRGHQHYFFNDINWMILPALVSDQYKLYLKSDAPMSYVSWAKVTPEILDRIKQTHQLRLAPEEWASGDIILVMDVVAPFGGMAKVIKELKDKEFAGQTINMYVPAMPGQSEGKIIQLSEAKDDPGSDASADDQTMH